MSVIFGGAKIKRIESKIDELKSALINKLNDLLKTPATGGTKQVTVGTTATQLSTTSIWCKTVVIKADDDNTGNVYVGFNNTVSSTTGFRLKAGQGITIDIDDLSKIWVIADTDNQKVHVLWVK